MTKTCSKCNEEKSISEYYRRGGSRGDQVTSRCKKCLGKLALARSIAWRSKNKDKCLAREAKWREENREKCRASYVKHYWKDPEKSRAYNREKRQKDAVNSNIRGAINTARRRAAKKQQTPLKQYSSEKKQIASIYRLAKILSIVYNTPYEVDHIIPLNPRDANAPLGLHVLANLQILDMSTNRSKADKVNY